MDTMVDIAGTVEGDTAVITALTMEVTDITAGMADTTDDMATGIDMEGTEAD